MSALLAVAALSHLVAAQPLAGRVPRMMAPVVHIRSLTPVRLSSLPWLNHIGHIQTAVGSGFVIESSKDDALILTNEHVVHHAARVIVTVDERQLPATVVGRDEELDVALLTVRAGRRLPAAKLGRSSTLQVGDGVVAVGNPFGLDHTVTSGIVSARLRVIEEAAQVPLLQTDASINPGNSGGPLYDLRGDVVGINTAIVAGANGIGFAVPIDFIRRGLPQLRRTGKIVRGFLGVRLDPVTQETATALGLGGAHGALVSGVVPGGPAAQAGLLPGDVIVRWDGLSIDSSASLPTAIALTPPGSHVEVRLLRGGAPISRRVLMAPQP
jgi:serine protease Do